MAPKFSRGSSILLGFAQSLLTAVILVGVLFIFRGSFNQIQAQRTYSLGVTCAVISADNNAIINAVANSDGYYSDPALKAFLTNPAVAPFLNRYHFPTEAQEEANAKKSAQYFSLYLTNAVTKSVGDTGKKFVNPNGTINCSRLKAATVQK